MNLGDKIYKIREVNSLSQEQLSEVLGISRQSVSKWETNQAIPENDKLIKISKMYNIRLESLLDSELELLFIKTNNNSNLNQVSNVLSIVSTIIIILSFIIPMISFIILKPIYLQSNDIVIMMPIFFFILTILTVILIVVNNFMIIKNKNIYLLFTVLFILLLISIRVESYFFTFSSNTDRDIYMAKSITRGLFYKTEIFTWLSVILLFISNTIKYVKNKFE